MKLDVGRVALAAVFVCAALSCADSPEAQRSWIDLSVGFEPRAATDSDLETLAKAGLPTVLGATVDERWRLRMGRTIADALVVVSGTSESVPVQFGRGAALWFDAASEATPGSLHTVSLALDGGELARFEVPNGSVVSQRISLPTIAGPARLSVHVSGPPGFIALRSPVIGPDEVGDPAHRPWTAPPDIALMIADTFRADNLAVSGGDPELAGALNEFARGARSFVEARAPATWTLPSHAALFTGRYPPEIGMMGARSLLGDEAVTLARHLRRLGYRTVAVTDGGFVSSNFGLDQGFDCFEEIGGRAEHDLAATARTFDRLLERDDGRPLFVLVQSYRAHSWVVDEATRERLGQRFEFQPDRVFRSSEWRDRLLELLRTANHGVPMSGPEFEQVVRTMIPNYRGASADASRGFGRLLERLRERGTLASGVVAFTSDHGESFGEHGVVSHGNGVWDGQARVPLVISSSRWQPGADDRMASLLDLPRTLCALANLPPHEDWGGVDLSADEREERPLFVFQTLQAKERYAAVILDGWKWIFLDDGGPGDLAFVYDLDHDRSEQRDLAPGLRGSEREREARELLRALYGPAPGGRAARLSPKETERIRALGYGSGGADEDE